MNPVDVLAELKRIRASVSSRRIQATENDLSRLIENLEREEDEMDKEWEKACDQSFRKLTEIYHA